MEKILRFLFTVLPQAEVLKKYIPLIMRKIKGK